MAESRESTILDVKLDAGKVAQDLQDLITRIAALKAQQKELNDQIKAGNDIDGKYAEQLIRVKDQLAWTEKQAKGLSATTKLLNADTLTYSDSLNGERQKLADMQKAYDQLDKAQRESEGGKAFLEAIKAQSDAVKGLEGDTGRFQRNVGNYPQIFQQVAPGINNATSALGRFNEMADLTPDAFKEMAKGIGGATKAALKFIATPLGAILTAIVAVIKLLQAGWSKLTEAIAKNDDAGTAVARLYAVVIQPAIDAVTAAFAKLADWVGKVANALADFFGGATKAGDAAESLVVATDNLEEAERNYVVNTAKNNAEIAKLRDKAVDKEKYTVAQRKQFLEEAAKLEKENLEADKAIKAEKLRIMEETAKRERDTSDATKDKIAKARADLYASEQAYYSKTKELNSQIIAMNNEEAAAAKAKADAIAKATEERIKKEQDILNQAADFAVSLIEDETARAIAKRKIQGEREIQALQERLEKEKDLTETAQAALAELIKGKQAALDAELEQMATDAANAKTEEELKAEQEKAMRILEYKRELAASGSEEELAIQKEILDAQMAQALENTELEEEEKYLIRETFAKKAEELDKQYHDSLVQQAKDAKAAYKDSLMATAKTASQAFGAMSDLLSAYGEENEEAAGAAKAFGFMQIIADQAISIADTAKAITAAVAGATEAAAAGGPAAPFLLAGYIAAMVGAVIGAVASVASTITQAKQLLSSSDKDAGKFATGGVVGGSSYSGDKLIAHVNSGEGIYTGSQANNLLQEIANNPARGGFDYSAMAEAMAVAVAAQPAPVMSYQEFTDFQQKVATYNELAKI
jgi:hypothetical protein